MGKGNPRGNSRRNGAERIGALRGAARTGAGQAASLGGTAARTGVDKEAIEKAVVTILRAIGESPEREGLVETPRRMADMYEELFSGLHEDPAKLLATGFEDEKHKEMVIVKDIPFASVCEHHLMPFHGLAHVGYIPQGRIVGISKIARMVETLARRPQVQERLTSQIADLLVDGLRARGVAVVIEATHLCMTIRGVKKPGSRIVTSATRGIFRENPSTRAEFLSLVKPSGR